MVYQQIIPWNQIKKTIILKQKNITALFGLEAFEFKPDVTVSESPAIAAAFLVRLFNRFS